MGLRLIPYDEEYRQQVRLFNQRIQDADLEDNKGLSEAVELSWLPSRKHERLYQQPFVSVDQDGAVRGGVILKHQDFLIDGKVVNIAAYRYPLSEGLIDSRYAIVGMQMLRSTIKKIQPRLFALGMGSLDNPHPRMLAAAGFLLRPVPYWFMVINGESFLKNLQMLKRPTWRRWVSSSLAYTGLGRLGVRLSQLLYARKDIQPGVTYEEVPRFEAWVDDVWQQGKAGFKFVAVRDAGVLRSLYPKEDDRFVRIKVSRGETPLGWAVLLNTRMKGNRHFGDMRVGTIVDCFSISGSEASVIAACRDTLVARNADLIISNQSADAWCEGLRTNGFIAGPSNFFLGFSKKIVEDLSPDAEETGRFHITRGDGDGPVGL